MLRSTLAPLLFTALYATGTGAQYVCDLYHAGTYQWPDRRTLPPQANTTCAATDGENRYYARQASSQPSSSSTSRSAAPSASSNPTNKTVIWLIEDEYKGEKFFDKWDFWNNSDPTNGQVTYVDRAFAFANNLSGVTDSGQVMMKGDDTTWLPEGKFRNSVRISSQKRYNSGSLFVLDVARAPWGCGVWPAFWSVGDNWPAQGEIDIIEGVHDNQYNQVAWHTAPGCNYTQNATYTGEIKTTNGAPNLECNACVNFNAGCGVSDWSQASYGEYFESTGGGVYAMKWDNESIAVWTFYRSAVPEDIVNGNPNPLNWGPPSAVLTNDNCSIAKFFWNHVIVFNITFCGDWAGNSYATTKCPGTCARRLMDPANFVNATWLINSLRVYHKTVIDGAIQRANGATPKAMSGTIGSAVAMSLAFSAAALYV